MNNKPKTKVLTISLLCCGRADTTERCLKSLLPIREAVDSEIQVIDTGCDPDTRAVVEKYADEVFDFTWCNDFAAARNYQLDVANGKWFLYLDDDEFFLDPENIIDFFLNDDYMKYNLGGYYQRNYLDMEGKEWSDITVIRMTTITPETYFHGKVHEFICPAFGNTIIFDTHAGHYGYVFKSAEDNRKHSQRNIPLLEQMMEEDPEELRWPYQLAQEIRADQGSEKLLELCQTYVDKLSGLNDKESRLYRGTFVVGRAMAEEDLFKFDELLEHYKEVMADETVTEMCKAKVSVFAAKQYYIRGDFENVKKATEYYLKVFEQMDGDHLEQFLSGGIFVYDTFEEAYVNQMYAYIMVCGMKKGNLKPLEKYIEKINWNAPVLRVNRGFITTLLDTCGLKGAKKELVNALKKFFIKDGLKKALMAEIRERYEIYDIDQLENIKSCMAKIEGQSDMAEYLALRIVEKNYFGKEDWSNYSEIKDALLDYANRVSKWYDAFGASCQEPLDASDATPDVLLSRKILQFVAMAELDYKEAMGALKDGLNYVPIMNKPIATLSKFYGDRQIIISAKASDPAKFEEMYKLEEAVLAQIAELEANGHGADAATTRGQVEAIIMQTYGVKTLH